MPGTHPVSRERGSRWRVFWVLPPVLLGVLVLALMANSRPPPAPSGAGETGLRVRTVEVPAIDLLPEVAGYGEVQPAKVWAAVAQVAGRIVEIHPRLRDGEILPAGTRLLRIDPVNYELQVAQVGAELAELDVQAANARASLAIDERNLRLAEREQARIANLSEQGTASKSDVDAAERTVLAARASVQNTRNTLALLPTRRRLLEARLAQAERDLANTRITAPFDLRITGLAVERDQYVGVGQTLFGGDAVHRVEIVAQMALSSLRHLFAGREGPIPSIADMETELPRFTGFRPRVRMDLGDQVAEWEAEFVRFSDRVDPRTRTIGVVIAVDRPLEKTIPGRRPPLSKGMFVEVVIRGRVQPGRLLVPRSAVRNGRVHVVDAESRLQVRPVEVLFSQGPATVLAGGVAAGDRVLVSEPVPAVAGMLLDPVPDAALQAQLAALAAR